MFNDDPKKVDPVIANWYRDKLYGLYVWQISTFLIFCGWIISSSTDLISFEGDRETSISVGIILGVVIVNFVWIKVINECYKRAKNASFGMIDEKLFKRSSIIILGLYLIVLILAIFD